MADRNMPIGSEGQNNLLKYSYLHSRTYNFNRALDLFGTGSIFEYNSMKSIAMNKLRKMIDKLEEREHTFYMSFNNPRIKDIKTFNEVLSESASYIKVLNKLNNEVFKNKIIVSYEDKLREIGLFYFTEHSIDFVDTDKMRIQIEQLIIDNINKSRKNEKTGKIAHKVSSVKGDVFKNVMRDMYEGIPNKNIKNLKDYVWEQILVFLNEDLKGENGQEIKLYLKRAYDTITTESLYNKSPEINTSDDSNVIGLIGELSAAGLLNAVEDLFHNETKNYYIGGTQNKEGKKLPVDFLVGKYGFQVKNTLSIKDTHSFKVQENISIETFSDRLIGADKKLMKYLLANIIYLQKNAEDENLTVSNYEYIINFVNQLISSYADMLLSTEAEEQNYNFSNLFFIYKSKYLIPISVMLEGAFEAIQRETQTELGGIGYINKNLGKEFKIKDGGSLSEGPKQIIQNKYQKIRESNLYGKELTYGGTLGPYGGELGQEVLKGAKIRINYTLTMNNLKNIENKIGIF